MAMAAAMEVGVVVAVVVAVVAVVVAEVVVAAAVEVGKEDETLDWTTECLSFESGPQWRREYSLRSGSCCYRPLI